MSGRIHVAIVGEISRRTVPALLFGRKSPGMLIEAPYTISATEQPKSALHECCSDANKHPRWILHPIKACEASSESGLEVTFHDAVRFRMVHRRAMELG